MFQLCEPLQVHQPRVGDLGVSQPEPLQPRVDLQVHQSGFGDLGAAQVEPFQLREWLERLNSLSGVLIRGPRRCSEAPRRPR